MYISIHLYTTDKGFFVFLITTLTDLRLLAFAFCNLFSGFLFPFGLLFLCLCVFSVLFLDLLIFVINIIGYWRCVFQWGCSTTLSNSTTFTSGSGYFCRNSSFLAGFLVHVVILGASLNCLP